MSYYHIRLFYYASKEPREIKHIDQLNLHKAYVVKGITEPYLSGESFKLQNKIFRPSDVSYFLIKRTPFKISSSADTCLVDFVDGIDVTEILLKRPKKEREKFSTITSKKSVFIVHGRDHKPMKELKAMLSEFGLNPIVLHEQPSASRTVVEKLEKYSDVGYAFVILTSDDIGALAEDVLGTSMNKVTESTRPLTQVIEELFMTARNKQMRFKLLELFSKFFTNRARQNVVLEFGYFIGLLGRDRVCCLYKGDIELPSDMHGIVYVPFKESVNEVKDKIIKELREAGYDIKETSEETKKWSIEWKDA
ncbi:MAG: nucleotide-binding protein [Candidatus Bathyarchaeota archaeon]|nr:nucleotide-binding protein [Candidatus Bathyarchaeota archaeon]